MENFSENDNFNELLAIKTVTGEKYSKIKTLNEDILIILSSKKEIMIEKLKLRKKLPVTLIQNIERIYFR